MKQRIFNYNLFSQNDLENFCVTNSNFKAYNFALNPNNLINFSIIYGPPKSGKTHLGLIWKKINKSIQLNKNNCQKILNEKINIFIDDVFVNLDEELLFHIVNHCFNYKLKILICTDILFKNYKFKLKDLSSRLKSFNLFEIKQPDDQLIYNLLIKLLSDRQIIINNTEIISYILNRINRTYEEIYFFVEKIDNLSLEKKRELTIPLIKELL